MSSASIIDLEELSNSFSSIASPTQSEAKLNALDSEDLDSSTSSGLYYLYVSSHIDFESSPKSLKKTSSEIREIDLLPSLNHKNKLIESKNISVEFGGGYEKDNDVCFFIISDLAKNLINFLQR